VLVVDDEPGMRLSCRKVLEAEGYQVETAEDGHKGLEAFRSRGPFDAVLVDLRMPRLGGLEFIEEARRLDEDALLLVITAYATIDTAVEATKRGAYGYIPKPFTPDELLLPVRNGLERRALSLEARALRRERERQLLELSAERSRSSTILACMTDAVLVVNRERQVVLRNPAAIRLLAETPPAAEAFPLERLSCEALRGLVAEVLDAGRGPAIVSRELDLDGRPFLANASPVIEPGGEVLGAVAVLRDLSDLRRLETAKSLFVSMVAHEIKNPLAAIEGYLQIILGGAGGDEIRVRQMMERALLKARTLREMLAELMSLRAMETGHFDLERVRLDLGSLLEEAVRAAAEKAAAKRINLALDPLPPGPLEVLGDRRALLEVFGNLLDNAVKYTPEGGSVRVGVTLSEGFVQACVRDTGLGVAPEDRERIFEEFVRVRNAQTASIPGTGLGLAIVRRLVAQHQGRVAVAGEPGRGSVFTVSLPRVHPD
jgi:signal transduction histidine kinase